MFHVTHCKSLLSLFRKKNPTELGLWTNIAPYLRQQGISVDVSCNNRPENHSNVSCEYADIKLDMAECEKDVTITSDKVENFECARSQSIILEDVENQCQSTPSTLQTISNQSETSGETGKYIECNAAQNSILQVPCNVISLNQSENWTDNSVGNSNYFTVMQEKNSAAEELTSQNTEIECMFENQSAMLQTELATKEGQCVTLKYRSQNQPIVLENQKWETSGSQPISQLEALESQPIILENQSERLEHQPIVLKNQFKALENVQIALKNQLENQPFLPENQSENQLIIMENQPKPLENQPIVLESQSEILESQPIVLENMSENQPVALECHEKVILNEELNYVLNKLLQ